MARVMNSPDNGPRKHSHKLIGAKTRKVTITIDEDDATFLEGFLGKKYLAFYFNEIVEKDIEACRRCLELQKELEAKIPEYRKIEIKTEKVKKKAGRPKTTISMEFEKEDLSPVEIAYEFECDDE